MQVLHQEEQIFYYKALVVVCAVHWAVLCVPVPHCVVVFFNNMNTVNMFNLMKPQLSFVPTMRFVVNTIFCANVDLHMLHISRVENVVADHLFQGQLWALATSHPDLHILPYKPPGMLPGAQGL